MTADRAMSVEAEELPFRQLAQTLPNLCWISDAEGRIIWVNDAWTAYTGMDVAAIHARGLAEIHDPAVHPEVLRLWAEVKARGEPAETAFPLKGPDGCYRPFRTQVTPLRDAGGAITRWFGINTDISDFAATQERLRTREEELNELIERAGDGIFVAAPDGRYIEVNPAGCALLGYSRDELLSLSIADLLDPADLPSSQLFAQSARAEPRTGEWKLRRKDGGWAEVEISARTLSDGRLLGLVRDISERIRDRERLQAERDALAARADEAEQYRRQFWEASRDLLAVFALGDGRPMMVNGPAWEQTLGYSAAEVLAADLHDLIHPDDRAETFAIHPVLEADGAVFGLENRYRHKDGGWVWISWSMVREGERVFCIGRDVTEERARALYAERAQRLEALGKLTGGVAHDFNNLLTTILGAVDLMQRRPDDKALRDRLMTAALAAVRRGERLTKQLLSFARREPSGAGASDARRLLEDMRPLLQSALGEDIALRYELDPAIGGCAIDPAQLEAAVLNLVVNARDAMRDGGIVTVRTRRPSDGELGRYSLSEEGYAVLEVLDTGEGMAPDVLAHVFEPFFTTKEIGKGSGLGLAQVYGAARQAGGVATVESELGAGTAVRLYLKTCELDGERPADAGPAERRSERVLLVEDDVLVGVVTESILEDCGYRVTRAADAMEALGVLRGGDFEILITDVRMPGAMNGVQLARAATQRDPALKVLLCSGWTAESLGRDMADARWPFLAKPFDQADLRAALADLAATPSAAAEG